MNDMAMNRRSSWALRAVALAVVTLGRGILGAFFTELYPELRTPHPLNLAGAMLQHVALSLITLALLAAWHGEALQAMERIAATDGLTGLHNRRAFMEQAEMALATARRHQEPLAVLLLDLDHFKQINDYSEIPCRVSSDLHEWRNDSGAVSTRDSVKLKSL